MRDLNLLEEAANTHPNNLGSLQDRWLTAYPNDVEIILAGNLNEFQATARKLTYTHQQIDGFRKEVVHGNLPGAASYAINYLLVKGANIANVRECVAMLRELTPRHAGTAATVYHQHICGPAAGDLVGFKLRTVSQQAIDRMFNKED